MQEILGKRIRFFRERASKSQFEIEIELNMSTGTLSRIESGKVNPTKETVLAIADNLSLNHNEIDYLIGITSIPANEYEIEKARIEVYEYFNQKVFAYLIDDRWRMYLISEPFRKVLGLTKEYINSVYGISTIQFITDPDLGILNLFSKEKYYDMLYHNLRYYYMEVGFMKHDLYVQKAINSINKNKIASEIWREIEGKTNVTYSIRKGRIIHFRILNKFDIPFIYNYEPLLNSSRFRVVDYTPANKFMNFLISLI